MENFTFSEHNSPVSKKEYEAFVEKKRTKLLLAQFRLRELNIPIMIHLNGMHSSGYTRILNLLNEWMDTRYIETHVHRPDTDEEAERPYFWKFWRRLPAKGTTGLFVGSWYTEPYLRFLRKEGDEQEFLDQMRRISDTEAMLTNDGMLMIKLWLHLSEDDKSKNKSEQLYNRPDYAWEVTMDDMQNGKQYTEKTRLAERVLHLTHTDQSPWYSIDASDPYLCDLNVMDVLINAFKRCIKDAEKNDEGKKNTQILPLNHIGIDHIGGISLSDSLSRKEYGKSMEKYWESLYTKAWDAHKKKRNIVIVLEGADAAGKGGAIRRLIRCIDARLYRVIQIAAPTSIEKSHHYLWRFWMHVPRAGYITIYDRSWYGRVLVERVEGFAKEEEWVRAYDEINEFEKELTDSGAIVLKFWLQISPDEQLKRFKKREKTDYKQYKLTDDDWRNRKKWGEYQQAANDMVAHTSTPHAPWNLISSEDKKFARVQIIETVERALKQLT
ncbi:MAG: polyphosphate:AMP phosphotransferase [Balneolales bacterium]|nr:polyphosphate:AMP phosphotransferase [Balneolales bacterium]